MYRFIIGTAFGAGVFFLVTDFMVSYRGSSESTFLSTTIVVVLATVIILSRTKQNGALKWYDALFHIPAVEILIGLPTGMLIQENVMFVFGYWGGLFLALLLGASVAGIFTVRILQRLGGA